MPIIDVLRTMWRQSMRPGERPPNVMGTPQQPEVLHPDQREMLLSLLKIRYHDRNFGTADQPFLELRFAESFSELRSFCLYYVHVDPVVLVEEPEEWAPRVAGKHGLTIAQIGHTPEHRESRLAHEEEIAWRVLSGDPVHPIAFRRLHNPGYVPVYEVTALFPFLMDQEGFSPYTLWWDAITNRRLQREATRRYLEEVPGETIGERVAVRNSRRREPIVLDDSSDEE